MIYAEVMEFSLSVHLCVIIECLKFIVVWSNLKLIIYREILFAEMFSCFTTLFASSSAASQ